MKKIFAAIVILMFVTPGAYSHSGRTDKNGGHKCSAKSKKKGLCTGYHYHKKNDQLGGILVIENSEKTKTHHHNRDEKHSHDDKDSEG